MIAYDTTIMSYPSPPLRIFIIILLNRLILLKLHVLRISHQGKTRTSLILEWFLKSTPCLPKNKYQYFNCYLVLLSWGRGQILLPYHIIEKVNICQNQNEISCRAESEKVNSWQIEISSLPRHWEHNFLSEPNWNILPLVVKPITELENGN